MNQASFPRHVCHRWVADGGPIDWSRFPAMALSDTVTGLPPAQTTAVRTAWDEEHWRVCFDALDANPWSTIIQRDGPLWTEEVVEVFFDPVGDLESYFEIEVNPAGVVCDLILRRTLSGWRKEFSWAVEGLVVEASRTPGGWRAELTIPFAALGPDRPSPGSEWRVNFLRIDRPNGPGSTADLSAWSPTGLRNFHRAERFGVMVFDGDVSN